MKSTFESPAFMPEGEKKEPAVGKQKLVDLEKIGAESFDDEEIFLATAEKEDSKRLWGGFNQVFIVNLKGGGKAVFKPLEGEKESSRQSVKAGTLFKRERAAALVDKFLGFNLVPPTVIRNLDGQIGSLQKFVDAESASEAPYNKCLKSQRQIAEMFVFDYLIYNSDRNSNNYLIDDTNVHAIDNALSFGRESERFYLWWQESINVFDINFLEEFKQKIIDLDNSQPQKESLKNLLSQLLNENEVSAFFERLKMTREVIEEYGRIPFELEKGLLYSANSE